MASFDFIYVTAEKGREHALLESLKLRVARFYGDYVLRTRRDSGWVQIQLLGNQFERDLGFGEMLDLLRKHPDQVPPAEADQCRELSRILGVDVVRVNAVTSVDAMEFTRCRGGEVVRHFLYSPQDETLRDGWGEEVGLPEPWEEPHTEGTLIDAADIGAPLGLPGLEKAHLPGEGASIFDLETTVVGQRMAVPASIKKARGLDLEGDDSLSRRFLVLAVAALVALVMWIIYRRWLAPSSSR